ncbi:MAG: amino acid adenylation domain-containing protein, partial [Bacteroidota bacterium]
VTLQNAQMATDPNRPQQMNGLSIRSLGQDNVRHSKFDISFIFEPCGNDVVLHLEYNTDLYDEPMARHLVQHLQQLLDSILADKQASLTSLDYIDSAEKHKLLHEFNATDVDFPSFLHLSELFAQQVEKTPDAIALIFEGQEWTYRQLDDASNRLAHFLVEHHQIQAGDWIGLTLDRTERLIVAILAIVKVGACYVPIDNQYPQDRIEYVLQDSECKLLLDENFFADFTTLEAKLSTKPIETTPELDGLYCCIYTSGSTGNPKGVLIPHAQVISRLQWAWKEFPYQSGEVASLRTTVSFVDHIGELWAPILAGIPSVLFGRNIQLDADAFRRALGAYKVSRITLVPTLLKELLKDEDSCREQLAQSKVWMISGEELQTELVARFYQILPRQKLINLYGATEITDATFFDTSQLCTTDELALEPAARYQQLLTKGRMPLGQPISNAQVYVLDKLQALVATEVVGEICVSGVTLNRGYWKKPELDAQKFVAHPFKTGEQLYRTGDLGRWRADGRLEYLGRMDHQVKIRGHRIELGEIENTLMRFPSVLQVVVRPWEDGPHQGQLVAYLRSAEKMELATLRQSLKSQLPSYMLPTHFVFLDEFPLSPNGKIDKKRLSLLGQSQIVRTPYVVARNELEQSLVDIWQEVLGVERIGIKEDFMEVGGHSLQVVQVLARIQNAMGIQLEIRHLYEGSTIEQLAEVIEFIRQQESLKYESEALLKIEI